MNGGPGKDGGGEGFGSNFGNKQRGPESKRGTKRAFVKGRDEKKAERKKRRLNSNTYQEKMESKKQFALRRSNIDIADGVELEGGKHNPLVQK